MIKTASSILHQWEQFSCGQVNVTPRLNELSRRLFTSIWASTRCFSTQLGRAVNSQLQHIYRSHLSRKTFYHHRQGLRSLPVALQRIWEVLVQFLQFFWNWQWYWHFWKENVRCPVWTCKDPISLILGTRLSILGTRIGSLKHLKKN